MKRLLTLALLAGSLLMPGMSHAGFIATDWKNQGDGLATLHEETGKEWLDLSQTDGKSVNYVLSQLGAGGEYEGWRLPTYMETVAMLNAFSGITTTSVTSTSTYWVGKATGFYNLFGKTYIPGDTSNGITHGLGFFLDDGGNVVRGGSSMKNSYGSRTGYFYAGASTTFSLDSTNSSYGVFLVSDGGLTLSSQNNPELNVNNPDAPVNQTETGGAGGGSGGPVSDVSSPFALSAFALLGLAGFRRKQKKVTDV